MVGRGTVPARVGMVSMLCYNEHILRGQGLVEVNSSAILGLVGSKQFMLSPSAVILLKVVPVAFLS